MPKFLFTMSSLEKSARESSIEQSQGRVRYMQSVKQSQLTSVDVKVAIKLYGVVQDEIEVRIQATEVSVNDSPIFHLDSYLCGWSQHQICEGILQI